MMNDVAQVKGRVGPPSHMSEHGQGQDHKSSGLFVTFLSKKIFRKYKHQWVMFIVVFMQYKRLCSNQV